ncbi:hypothetical protein ACJX0J_037754, partial [Zea mays]
MLGGNMNSPGVQPKTTHKENCPPDNHKNVQATKTLSSSTAAVLINWESPVSFCCIFLRLGDKSRKKFQDMFIFHFPQNLAICFLWSGFRVYSDVFHQLGKTGMFEKAIGITPRHSEKKIKLVQVLLGFENITTEKRA